MGYAEGTTVSISKSLMDIDALTARYGAANYSYWKQEKTTTIAFEIDGIGVRIAVNMPERDSEEYTRTDKGKPRSPDVADKAWNQACKSRYRALHLVVKAKLESVETGIATFEEEFLAFIVLPNGYTIGENILPKLNELTAGRVSTSKLLTQGNHK